LPKLKPEVREQVAREACVPGASLTEIGKKYGLTPAGVWYYAHRKYPISDRLSEDYASQPEKEPEEEIEPEPEEPEPSEPSRPSDTSGEPSGEPSGAPSQPPTPRPPSPASPLPPPAPGPGDSLRLPLAPVQLLHKARRKAIQTKMEEGEGGDGDEDEEKLAKLERQHILEIRGRTVESKKPLLSKEVEKLAYYGNILWDLGAYTFERLNPLLDLPPEAIHGKNAADIAYGKFTDLLDSLVDCQLHPEKVESMKAENARLRALLDFYREALEIEGAKTKIALDRGKALLSHICPDCTQKALQGMIFLGMEPLKEPSPTPLTQEQQEQEA